MDKEQNYENPGYLEQFENAEYIKIVRGLSSFGDFQVLNENKYNT